MDRQQGEQLPAYIPRYGRWNIIAPTHYANNFRPSITHQGMHPRSSDDEPPHRQEDAKHPDNYNSHKHQTMVEADPEAYPGDESNKGVDEPMAPLPHLVLLKQVWDMLRGSERWLAMDKARSVSLKNILSGVSNDRYITTGLVEGFFRTDKALHVSKLLDPTQGVRKTAESLLLSASSDETIGWYILNYGVGVEVPPSVVDELCNVLSASTHLLPGTRPDALFRLMVIDCIKSKDSTDAHLECYDAVDALRCNRDGTWEMQLHALNTLTWSIDFEEN